MLEFYLDVADHRGYESISRHCINPDNQHQLWHAQCEELIEYEYDEFDKIVSVCGNL